MKIIKKLALIALTIAIYSCARKESKIGQEETTGFTLTGEVNGFLDSTWLYLDNTSTKTTDSAMVIQGDFSFKGRIEDSTRATHVVLRSKGFNDYKFLWLENAHIG